MRTRVFRWLAGLMLAEAAGIALVAVTYAALDRGLAGPAAVVVLAAGAFEGLCLGLAQARVLAPLGVSRAKWVGLTIAAAAAGYGLSLAAMAGADQGAQAATADPALWIIALAGGGVGLGMGALMGLIQAAALPRGLRARAWILANLAGWPPAMALIMAAASLAQPTWPLLQIALLGAGSGAGAGLCVALATWPVLARAD